MANPLFEWRPPFALMGMPLVWTCSWNAVHATRMQAGPPPESHSGQLRRSCRAGNLLCFRVYSLELHPRQCFQSGQCRFVVRQFAFIFNLQIEDVEERRQQRLKVLAICLVRRQCRTKRRFRLRDEPLFVYPQLISRSLSEDKLVLDFSEATLQLGF